MFVPREPKRNKAKLPSLQVGVPDKVKTFQSLPSHEQVSLRAYEIYQSGGYTHGRDQQDWLRAEQEVLAKVVIGRHE
jgi:Protein of unknown function (DUF2934)